MTDTLDLENIEQGIPALRRNRQQRPYYPLNFRRCVKILWIMIILNLLILLAILYCFFTRPAEQYYATSFAGKVTHILATSNPQIALAVTKQHQNDS